MELDIILYDNLLDSTQVKAHQKLEAALLQKGIVGIHGVPNFEKKSREYVAAAREFSALDISIKQAYAPERDVGKTEGYELGAEWFKNANDEWILDDKKASYYAFVPDHNNNKWPSEVLLRQSYLALGEMIFKIGKTLLRILGLDESVGLKHDEMIGYGRMLHYLKESENTNANPNWCGAHFDHGIFTGLMPAYYFINGIEVSEPAEAGLYIQPHTSDKFEKINATDKSILLFQAGEFGQLISNDRIKATKHLVKKPQGEIERYTFALFHSAADDMQIRSSSVLIDDDRYRGQQSPQGEINYIKWANASYDRYRAR